MHEQPNEPIGDLATDEDVEAHRYKNRPLVEEDPDGEDVEGHRYKNRP
ncbi:hypothetical protein QWY28_20610 [Nocardioides sp. SOB77]|uniref:Uncharacterized protein n=1 Tax=Nocardioides oceani TaxID=3058369 RepID=A0ABT8FLN0_9ACTN|nr:hypothetical protein [Nocardioides oceani]MDN4175380.1 hypothetical protein [Nocardioides oceani]